MVISACGYQRFFDISSCFEWILINLYALFIMFSCSVFCAAITGNSFAMVVLNILFHTVLIILSACSMFVAETFIYGLSYKNSIVDVLQDISDEIELKIQMLECHESQLKWMRDHDNIDFAEFVRTCSRFRGLQSGVDYAEGFTQELVWPKVVTRRLLP